MRHFALMCLDVVAIMLLTASTTVGQPQQLTIDSTSGGTLRVDLRLNNEPITLTLEAHSVRSPRFRVLVDNGAALAEQAHVGVPTYRGAIEGRPGSVVAASMHGNSFGAIVWPDGVGQPAWEIRETDRRGVDGGLMYDVVPGSPAFNQSRTCGAPDHHHRHDEPAPIGIAANRGGPAGGLLVAELGIDADFALVSRFRGNPVLTQIQIEALVNSVSLVYERDTGIRHELSTIVIRSSVAADPYVGTDPGTLLETLRSQWTGPLSSEPHDLAHLVSGRNFDGSVVGLAYVGTVCTGSRYGVNQYLDSETSNTALLAHEAGHNWSASHCNSDPECRIMCSGLGGCTGLGEVAFTSGPIAQIANYAASASCIDLLPIELPLRDDFDAGTFSQQTWSETNGVTIETDPLATSGTGVAAIAPGGTLVTEAVEFGPSTRISLSAFGRELEGEGVVEIEALGTRNTWSRIARIPLSHDAVLESGVFQVSPAIVGSTTNLRVLGVSQGGTVRVDDFLLDNEIPLPSSTPAPFADGFENGNLQLTRWQPSAPVAAPSTGAPEGDFEAVLLPGVELQTLPITDPADAPLIATMQVGGEVANAGLVIAWVNTQGEVESSTHVPPGSPGYLPVALPGAAGRSLRIASEATSGSWRIDDILIARDTTPPCPADVNNDGTLTGADFNSFLTAYAAGDDQADQNRDGALSGADFNAFLTNFAAGCS